MNTEPEALTQIAHARHCAKMLREHKQTERHEMSAESLEWLSTEIERLHAANADFLVALEILMDWQAKNVRCWHNSAYDNAYRVIKKHGGQQCAASPTST